MSNKQTLLRICSAAAVIYTAFLYFTSCRDLALVRERADAAEAELTRCINEQAELSSQLASLDDEDTLRRLAWERLGMTESGETVFYFTDKEG